MYVEVIASQSSVFRHSVQFLGRCMRLVVVLGLVYERPVRFYTTLWTQPLCETD